MICDSNPDLENILDGYYEGVSPNYIVVNQSLFLSEPI